jgi:hypothetical protein
MTLRDTQISLGVVAKYSVTKDLSLANAAYNFAKSVTLADGTGSGQADKIYADTDTIAASGTKDWDLAGVLVDDLGVALTFVNVKGIFLAASSANTNNCVIGAAAATQFVGPFGAATHTIAVKPGQFFAITAGLTGWAVGAGASDLLRVTNSAGGTSVTYDIMIIGTSA